MIAGCSRHSSGTHTGASLDQTNFAYSTMCSWMVGPQTLPKNEAVSLDYPEKMAWLETAQTLSNGQFSI
jgi:hypothetical protein